ncbi:MAG: hypothetical protein MI723_01290, partial [Caulobacterales bacterium]|nr:hypothetical protein [Caulobacterales bacterium]
MITSDAPRAVLAALAAAACASVETGDRPADPAAAARLDARGSPLVWRHIAAAGDEGGDVGAVMLEMHALGRCGLAGEADPGPALGRGADGPALKAAPAIGYR